ncbi:MAG: hypothetical protein EAZ23_19760 [Oscillatoriales cyanobacterium]|nr:MAG: hypothetical protein EAZ23_19760 [Oscillatoriales cyanobacterium]
MRPDPPLAVNCQLSTVNCQTILDFGFWIFDWGLKIFVGFWIFDWGLKIFDCQLSTVNCQLSTLPSSFFLRDNCQLSTVNCQLFNLPLCQSKFVSELSPLQTIQDASN